VNIPHARLASRLVRGLGEAIFFADGEYIRHVRRLDVVSAMVI